MLKFVLVSFSCLVVTMVMIWPTLGMRRIFWIGFSVSAMAYFLGMPRWQEYAQLPDEFSTPTN